MQYCPVLCWTGFGHPSSLSILGILVSIKGQKENMIVVLTVKSFSWCPRTKTHCLFFNLHVLTTTCYKTEALWLWEGLCAGQHFLLSVSMPHIGSLITRQSKNSCAPQSNLQWVQNSCYSCHSEKKHCWMVSSGWYDLPKSLFWYS